MRLLVLLLLAACHIDQGISDDSKDDDTGGDTDVYDPNVVDTDMDGTVDARDCEPTIQDIHPGARELCDLLDNDCDGDVDEGFDQDDDGYMDVRECYALPGEWDCDDDNEAVNPDADEVCDGVDNDCNDATDEVDEDADGVTFCTDCDDEDAFVSPGQAEACDGIDNDCNGQIDEVWDADGDGMSPCQGDCDDENEAVNPRAGDACDGIDNDCNGIIDDAFDADHDLVTTCGGDCDDGNATVFPGAPELCDGLNNDCDAATVETIDGDGDGYTICSGDCDDGDTRALPGGTEECDGVDNDCSGHTDDRMDCWGCSEVGTYILCTSSADWNEAEDVCEGLGATLARVDDSSENTDLTSFTSSPTWIGATDQAVEGTWTLPDGVTPLPYDRWEAGEPNDENNDCALFNNGGHRGYWADASCAAAYRFLCEY